MILRCQLLLRVIILVFNALKTKVQSWNKLKTVYLLVALNLCSFSVLSQVIKELDSLKLILNTESEATLNKAQILTSILHLEKNRDSALTYAAELLEVGFKVNLPSSIHVAYTYLALSNVEKGSLEIGLKYHTLALENAHKPNEKGTSFSNIGNVYSTNGNYKDAFRYYRRAFDIFLKIQDSLRLGTTAITMGYDYHICNIADSAFYYLAFSKHIFETITHSHKRYYWAYAEGNLALVQAKAGQFDTSEKALINAIEILDGYNDSYAICDFEFQLAKIYFEKNEVEKALSKALLAFNKANAFGYKEFIRDGSEILSYLYSEIGDYKKAYNYQSTYISYKDSLLNADLIRKLADQEKEYEVGQKQTEVDLITAQQKTERVVLWAITGFAIVLFVLAFIIYKYYRSKTKVNKILEDQKVQLESLNSTKDKFFSIISHDLRGPVTSFYGISRMIKYLVKSKETDQLLEIADDIDQSVERLSSLLDNLLSWAMQQQGAFPNTPEKIDLAEMSQEIVGTFDNMASSKKIVLKSVISPEIALFADRKMSETILRNLVNNALKFTPENGSVILAANTDNDFAHITVSDTGVGIPEDKLNNLFRLQDKKSTYGTSGEKGLGLGLQLVYEFIAANKGKIEVSSTEGQGTVFHIYLPLFSLENAEILV
ncbi:MAG: two-component system NtrC family sensor kinase [Cyclobacteriaceae bacterium]|jgi:two-component system NtrC family sensor kinase